MKLLNLSVYLCIAETPGRKCCVSPKTDILGVKGNEVSD